MSAFAISLLVLLSDVCRADTDKLDESIRHKCLRTHLSHSDSISKLDSLWLNPCPDSRRTSIQLQSVPFALEIRTT